MYVRSTLLTTILAASRLVASVPAVAADPEGRDVVWVTQVETVTKHAPQPTYHQHHPWAHAPNPHQHQHLAPQPHTEPHPSEDPSPDDPKPPPTDSDPDGYGEGSDPRGWGSSSNNYKDMVLHHHNIHRANHSARPITWSPSLANTAEKIAKTCVYAHNTKMNGGGYGQNIAAGPPADLVSKVITNMFYNHEVGWYRGLYGQAKPSMQNFEHWGHFSQIVWKGTTQVGCFTADCSNHPGKLKNVGPSVHPFFTVCNYHNRGNMGGQYGKNVGKPLGHPSVYAV